MAEKDITPKLLEKSEAQSLAQKSRVIKSAFSAHSRHVSAGLIKETLNSKPNVEELANLSEVIEELEFQAVETKVSSQTETSVLDNLLCFFENGSLALISMRDENTLTVSFSGRRGLQISKEQLLQLPKVRFLAFYPKFEAKRNVNDRVKLLNPFSNLGGMNFFWVALATFTSNVLGLATSIFIMVVYDRVLPNQADQSLYALAFGVGVAIIFDQFFKAARGGILEQSAVYKDKKSNDDIFEQFVETKTDLTKRSIGSLSTVSRDYETYKEFVSSAGLILFIDLPFIFVFVWSFDGAMIDSKNGLGL